ncbi:CYTH and CHAD domain-containing protein [Frigoribacterium sp. PhB24]|uniref:CYTH and CHAD domain-containing protein n=1 Tax=Frigoribacterium sp. PhB24 TaxID=2485204 RepID=UPI000F47D89F|nr:CYTH and CHAD domain-containing protein [Frigoribacterium sp. PhB24]ROS48491.1 CYTH domain-containing protein [Frigoribacterium sp. PhB24]
MSSASPRRTEQTEIERKYDVHESAGVPDLVGAGGDGEPDALVVGGAEHDDPVELAATYWDTVDHTLLGARTTLRRREGGGDAGWHLKLPPSAGTSGRREVHWPLGDPDEPVPDALRRLVEARLRGRPLHPVLRLETTRTTTRLLDGSGRDVAELADDVVRASNPDTAVLRTWREWEVELASGVDGAEGERLLDAVAERLEAAGASVSSSKSKLARGLGSEPAGGRSPSGGGTGGVDPSTSSSARAPKKNSAAAFVASAAAGLRDELLAIDAAVRDDEPDAVRRLRTTTRRLRALLTVWDDVLDPGLAATVVAGAVHVGHVSGAARDVEVARGRVATRASSAPTGFVTVQATGRLEVGLGERLGEAVGDVRRLLDSGTWFDLLDAVDALVAAPATGDHAADPAVELSAARLQAERKRTKRVVRAGLAALDATDHESGVEALAALHDARKAARRLRYALEADRVRSGSGRGRARRARAVQEALGEHRDALAAVRTLREVAAVAHRAGEDTFGHGVLATLEVARADDALRRFRRAARRL